MARARKQPDIAPAVEPGAEEKKQRAHNPEVLGSRVYCKGGVYYLDERWRGGRRHVLREPNGLGGPGSGVTTRDQETAQQWARVYDARWKREQEEDAQRATGIFRTLSLGVDKFLTHRKRHKAASTLSGSRTATAHLMEWMGPDADPAEVTTEELQEMFDDLLDSEYEASSLHNIRYHLRAFFDHLKVVPNPARDVELPKMGKADIKPWDKRQRDRLRKTADRIDQERGDDRRTCRRLVECLLSMGLRIQEAAAIQWEDVNKQTKVVRVSQQIARVTGKRTDTKGKEPRSATVMSEWWVVHDEEGEGLIIAGPDGGPIPNRTLYGYVREILERTGLKKPGVAAHQCRHTYSFVFIERGGTLDELSKCLGHKKLSTTQKYYEHFTSHHAAAAAARRMYGGGGSVRRGPRKKG